MPKLVRREYWDACLFIDLLNGTPSRIDVLEALYDDLKATDASVVGVTSTFTIAEVAFAAHEKAGASLDTRALASIDGFWGQESPIEMVELYNGLALDARELIRQAVGLSMQLKPADAIHLATARRRGVHKFLTYDARLHAFTGMFGFPVHEPRIETLPFPRDQIGHAT